MSSCIRDSAGFCQLRLTRASLVADVMGNLEAMRTFISRIRLSNHEHMLRDTDMLYGIRNVKSARSLWPAGRQTTHWKIWTDDSFGSRWAADER